MADRGGRGGMTDRGGRGGGRGRGDRTRGPTQERQQENRWDHDRRGYSESENWDSESRGMRPNRMNGNRGRGNTNGRPMNPNNRIREDQTQSFIKDIRRTVDAEKGPYIKEYNGSWNDSNDWNASAKTDKQSPRHKARQPFNSNLNPNNSWKGSSDWNDQEDEWESQPMTPTAMVSPRKIEEKEGELMVTRNSERLSSRTSNPPNSPPKQIPHIKPLRNDVANQYGAPAPFKENGKPPPLIQQDVGFPQHSSQYNKPFSQSHDTPSSNWKCPDPGCKQLNGANRSNCTKCGIAYKAANDYISNYACDRVKQEYSNNKKNLYNKADNYSNSSNSSNGFQSSPSIPQPMLPQTQHSIKDWNLDIEETQAQHNWPTPITTTVDSWGVENMLIAQHQLVGIDPSTMQYSMMMNQVQVPSYPPPFFNPSQHMAPVPPFYAQSGTDYFPNQPADFQTGFPQNNLTVFNPSAQVFVPPVDQLPAPIYKAPPPIPAAQKTYQPTTVSNTRPVKPAANPSFNSGSPDPNLIISLNKPPTPLALRRPQEQRPITKTSSDKLINKNSLEKEKPDFVRQISNEGNQTSSKLPPRFQRQRENQTKPPSMIEMQSGSLKKGNLPPPPPGKGNGLLIFGTSNVVNHLDESKLASQLKIPVKCIPAMKLDVFQEKSILLNPSRDWLVLVHGLGNDARNIALTRKSDAEKASEADDIANEFCDIIENRILGSAQHICVLVSMLLPRVDFQEKPGMANPNNVRKVINVQITQRLYENPRVTLINSDKALAWGDDEEVLNELMEADGYHLTDKGFGVMINNWTEHIKKKMRDTNYNPESPKNVQPSTTIKRLEPTPLVADIRPSVHEDASKATPHDDMHNLCTDVPDQKTDDLVADVEGTPLDEEETVPDPFGSYEAPCEIVSPKARTISTSGPFAEDVEELDDDELPNLEIVVPSNTTSPKNMNGQVPENGLNLENQFSSIAIDESRDKVPNGLKGKLKIVPDHEDDDDEEFHDVDDGGFIDDSYCGDAEFKDSVALPSMMSLGPSSDIGPVSGHFLEDSYLPSSETNGGLEGRKTVEFCFKSELTVKIAGDFNSWDPQLMEKGSDNCWKFLIDLPEGEYHYKYLVEGDWLVDEVSPVSERDGNKNNMLTVSCEISKS
eukprot:TRINITY_DN8771_c0_g1_i1.p1 TRINITY_DN8771_c0_g1~~TRINITY_DN8771_c0_g1_i1.p1  ORF type:complete len:1155 (-),score=284.07 TRINITY_DN8771_c0_g1_i1:295-3714(-)